MDKDRLEAIQNVVDRVSSYQDGAPEGTVEQELRKAAEEADLDLDDAQLDALSSAIEEHGGDFPVAEVLGSSDD